MQMLSHLLASALLAVMVIAQGCGGARPYGAMYKSVSSELSAPAQARDHRLTMNLQATLVSEEGLHGPTLSPHVIMERGYVIGRIDTPEQAARILRVTRSVGGLRSVDEYLPVTPAQATEDTSRVSDVVSETEIASALRAAPGVVASRINVSVLDRQVVLLGVVSGDDERRRAIEAVSKVGGVRGVTNWLLLPEPEYMAVQPHLR